MQIFLILPFTIYTDFDKLAQLQDFFIFFLITTTAFSEQLWVGSNECVRGVC